MVLKKDNVLGIDASTNSLAWCHMKNNTPVEWGEMQYSHDSNLFRRLASIEQRAGIIVDRYESIDFVVIEAPVKVQNMRVAISLAYSYGIVAAKFASKGINVSDVPPITWQKYIGNNSFSKQEKEQLRKEYPGRSTSWYNNKMRQIRKGRTMDWVENTFGITAKNDNVSDAISIAAYAIKFKG